MKLNLKINSENKVFDIDVRDTLMDVLRANGYKSVKHGCETGECGACTVIVNGLTVNSCIYPAVKCEDAELITCEGLEKDGKLSILQEKFIEMGAIQCGYCTPGMLLSAHALLMKNPNPKLEDVKDALSGNFCRCTGYKKPVDAVMAAAKEMKGAK
ncbi:MAG TPA: (2Fe-2S)-binding protein [Candidatus Wallbacteria bacterium]|nr:MAG: Nicotinate dehydrogenase small FeS subunit [bacterium ADurb.Bin243]HOD41885.1 (2Fe-2S)-binding protein [Candidatus Wallbacteria bacterium]HPG58221.1 (2Fe-2S)-binding protein [Candidatus Wallbacteria bacterium]